jgi:uncharacterized membrane protein
MLTTKLVIRLLDFHGRLLGWAEVQAAIRGDGTLFVAQPTHIMVETEGQPASISVHWVDVNVETRMPTPITTWVTLGQIVTLTGDWTALIVGPAAGGLPPVTVKAPVSLAIPQGRLG